MKTIKKLFWFTKGMLANLIYGFPSRKLFLIGVTGTDGKTTTTVLIHHLLKQNGYKASYISTVGAEIAGKKQDLGYHVTTPRFFALQKMLRQSLKQNYKYMVLEVTSHAIDQLRICGCSFEIAVLTNIAEEHLDYHRNYQNYAKTKIKLLNKAKIAVVNKEAETYYRYHKLIKNKNLWTTAVLKKANFRYPDLLKAGLKDTFVGFEKENIVLAYAVGNLLGIKKTQSIQAFNRFKRVKGRFDHFYLNGYQFLVDFAHTPNAFRKLFQAIRQELKYKRLIHVFGCAGERDQYKRVKMGQLSASHADLIILTEEDYRREKIETIFQDIEKGIKKVPTHVKDQTYFQVENRQKAIELALKKAKHSDLILLTGKAHEPSLARGHQEYAWDEYKAIEKAFKTTV